MADSPSGGRAAAIKNNIIKRAGEGKPSGAKNRKKPKKK